MAKDPNAIHVVVKKSYDTAGAVNAFHEINGYIKMLEEERDRLKAQILADMGGEESKIYPFGRTTWKVVNKAIPSTRVDVKAIRDKYPDIAEECSTTSMTYRFTIK